MSRFRGILDRDRTLEGATRSQCQQDHQTTIAPLPQRLDAGHHEDDGGSDPGHEEAEAGRSRPRLGSGRDAGNDIEADAGQPMKSGRVKPEIAHLGPGHAPLETDVDRQPRHVLGQQGLGALVETRALDPG